MNNSFGFIQERSTKDTKFLQRKYPEQLKATQGEPNENKVFNQIYLVLEIDIHPEFRCLTID